MFYGPANFEDGYVEVLVSILHGSPNLFRLRAVRDSRGEFRAVVREYESGIMLHADTSGYKTWYDAICAANEWVHTFLAEHIYTEHYFPSKHRIKL